MTEYALLIDDTFKEIRRFNEKPEDIPHKNISWYEVSREFGLEEFTGVIDDKWVIKKIDPSTQVQEPIVPYSVSARQVRLLLLQQNLLSDVETMIAEQDKATQISWQYSSNFYRDDPLLNELAKNLNLSDEQIDEFFTLASKL